MVLAENCIHRICVCISNTQYKLMQYLMIRDYYLKGPTVTDLFVITCTTPVIMNAFALMHVLYRSPLKFYTN